MIQHNYPRVIVHGDDYKLDGSLAEFGGWVDSGDGSAYLVEVFCIGDKVGASYDFRGLPRHLDGIVMRVDDSERPVGTTPNERQERIANDQLTILKFAVGACQRLPRHITAEYGDESQNPQSLFYRP